MEMDKRCVLIVEGESDRGFFEQVCKLLNLHPTISVAVPKDYQGKTRNSKQGVFTILNRSLPSLKEEENPLTHLGIIVDADYPNTNGLGYFQTLEQIENIAKAHGFSQIENHSKGVIFAHDDDNTVHFGVWIMPNNQHDGMLEDFIKTCIHQNEQSLFDYATQTINAISEPKFDKEIHLTKAQIATWLAWQKIPGHGFYATMTDNLLHTEHELFLELQNWLKQVFAE